MGYEYYLSNIEIMIGNNLKRLRKESKMTQLELAKLSEINDEQIISKIERGVTKEPTLPTLLKLKKALGCSLDELVLDNEKTSEEDEFKWLIEQLKESSSERKNVAREFLKSIVHQDMQERISNKISKI